jgi:hypothetical protein
MAVGDSVSANDIINLSLKEAGALGVGQTPLAEDINDAFLILNGMLSQWQRRRYMIYHLVDVAYQATGAASYTIGVGGNFNTARPAGINSAFVRQINGASQVDYPLNVMSSREDYSDIVSKSVQSLPMAVYYDASYPLGTLYFWPVPTSLYQLHVVVYESLPKFTNLATQLSLPPEYFEAIHYNLACRLRPAYQLPPEPSLVQLAKSALDTVKMANTQVPHMKMPPGLQGGGRFNIYAGTVN